MPLKIVARTKSTPLITCVEDYLSACRARGLSPKTVRWSYGHPLREILLPFAEREGITEVAQLTNRVLDRLTNELQDGGGKRGPLAAASIHAYTRGINGFLNWARREGEDVGGRAQLPKLPRRLVDVLTREELTRMEDAAQSERDKLIIRLLADTGIRVGELVGLHPRDLIERDRAHYIQVHGKGSKDRMVPVPRLYRRLERYAERGRPRGAASDRLFLGLRKDRRTGDYEPLTPSGVLSLVKNAAELAGVEKRVYPHLVRHSFATFQVQRGMNPIQLAAILGHTDLTMIQAVYSHLSPGDAYEALQRTLTEDDAG